MEESGGKGNGESFYMKSKLCDHFAEWGGGNLIYTTSNYSSICAKCLLLGNHLSHLFPA